MEPGTQIGGGAFTIEAKIGHNALGDLLLARDETAGEQVVLIALPAAFSDDETPLHELFQETVERYMAFSHPRMPPLRGHVLDADFNTRFLIRAFQDGQTLAAHRAAQPDGILSLGEALTILRKIAEALNQAHLAGFAHRNLCPDNIMITEDGDVRILDVGIIYELRAMAWRGGADLDLGAMRVDSPYSCPEQFLLKHTEVGAAREFTLLAEHGGARFLPRMSGSGGDVFALAVLFYELISNKLPFADIDWETVASTWWKGQGPSPPPLSVLTEPQNLVLARALNWDPRLRLASVLAFVNAMGVVEDPAAPGDSDPSDAPSAEAAPAAVEAEPEDDPSEAAGDPDGAAPETLSETLTTEAGAVESGLSDASPEAGPSEAEPDWNPQPESGTGLDAGAVEESADPQAAREAPPAESPPPDSPAPESAPETGDQAADSGSLAASGRWAEDPACSHGSGESNSPWAREAPLDPDEPDYDEREDLPSRTWAPILLILALLAIGGLLWRFALPEDPGPVDSNNIDSLLRAADQDLVDLDLSLESARRAAQRYQRVLGLDADNDEARFGLRQVAERLGRVIASTGVGAEPMGSSLLPGPVVPTPSGDSPAARAERELAAARARIGALEAALADRERLAVRLALLEQRLQGEASPVEDDSSPALGGEPAPQSSPAPLSDSHRALSEGEWAREDPRANALLNETPIALGSAPGPMGVAPFEEPREPPEAGSGSPEPEMSTPDPMNGAAPRLTPGRAASATAAQENVDARSPAPAATPEPTRANGSPTRPVAASGESYVVQLDSVGGPGEADAALARIGAIQLDGAAIPAFQREVRMGTASWFRIGAGPFASRAQAAAAAELLRERLGQNGVVVAAPR